MATTKNGDNGNRLPRYLVSVDEIEAELDNHQDSQSQPQESDSEDAEASSTLKEQERKVQSLPGRESDVEILSDGSQLASLSDPDSDADFAVRKRTKRSSKTTRCKRFKEAVWEEYVTVYDKNAKVKSNKCKRCGKQVSPKAVRMKKHLESHKGQTKLLRDPPTSLASAEPASSSKDVPDRTFPSTADIKSRMKVWKSNTAQKAGEEMDTLIGKMIFSGNLAFSVSDNPYLKKITTKAQIPKYQPPNPQKIGGAILDEVYEECCTSNLEKFRNRKVTLLQDGWSTNQNAPVICHSIQYGTDTLMFDAVSTGTNKKDADYCFMLLKNAIAKAEKEYHCTVVGIVTDNCSVMKNMRDKANEKLGGVFAYGCVAHIINLCGQQLTNDDLIHQIIKVQRYFRNHHYESAALASYSGNRPSIPGKTRWNSQLDTLESYDKNHLIYLRIGREPESNVSKNEELLSILNDGNIYSNVRLQLALLKPVAIALDKVQSDKCFLADAAEIWINMFQKLPIQYQRNEKILEKADMVLTGVALAAFMLHPLYRGRGLTREQETKGFAEMEKRHFLLAVTASSLKALDDTVFPVHLLKDNAISLMSPNAWWRSVGAYSSRVNPNVVEICENLMMLPSSTAALERAFSTMGNIITKKRNRLGLEKARKLAVVNKTLAVAQEDNFDEDE